MKIYYYFILGLFIFTACEPEIETPDWRVTTEAESYQAGEEVLFQFQGNSDIVAFYSGEPYHDYDYKDGRVLDISDAGYNLSFTSSVINGSQENQLSLLVSSNFNGDYESIDAVNAADWTDITDRFEFGNAATFLNSTTQDISDVIAPGNTVYFAFKYVTEPQEENGLARNWMIQGFTFNSNKEFNNSQIPISDQPNAGFRVVDQYEEEAPSQSTITSTRVSLWGNYFKHPDDPIFDPENPIYDPENPIYDQSSGQYDPAAVRPPFVPFDPDSPYNDPATETWAVSKPFEVEEVNVGPDRPVALKGVRNNNLDSYAFSYNNQGNYTATFLVKNATIDGSKELVRQIPISILPE